MRLSWLWLLLLLGAGCASGAQSAAMVARQVPTVRRTHEAVSVTVDGGQQTDPMWMSKISNQDYKAALVDSLNRSRLFERVQDTGEPPLRLALLLESLEQPLAGFDMTVVLRVHWQLLRMPDKTVLWHDRINTVYTAKFGDALAGLKRLRLATEGAARENIEEGLRKLAAME